MDNESTSNEKCPKCNDTGIVREKNGSCHVCYDCLMAGKLNQHSEKLPDSRIKL